MDSNEPLPQVGERDDEYIQLRVRDDADFRTRLLDWLRANDVDPTQIPAYERPSLTGGQLTFQVFTLTDDGRKQVDPVDDKLLSHTVTVPMKVPPAPDLARWLVPPCPECGR